MNPSISDSDHACQSGYLSRPCVDAIPTSGRAIAFHGADLQVPGDLRDAGEPGDGDGRARSEGTLGICAPALDRAVAQARAAHVRGDRDLDRAAEAHDIRRRGA